MRAARRWERLRLLTGGRRSGGCRRGAAAWAHTSQATAVRSHRLLGHLPEQELGARPAEAVALLALVAGQDVEPVEGGDGTDRRWRIARQVVADRVISTVDPDARHAHKTVQRRLDGFKAHVLAEPDTGLITGCTLTRASGPDTGEAVIGVGFLAADDSARAAVAVLADSAYGTGACSPRWPPPGTPR